MTQAMTVADQLDVALAAYEELATLGEEVEDEWTYVTDLSAAWTARIEDVAAERGAEPVEASAAAAVDRAIDEVGRITDPHRAIDWLSTFPQVVLVSVGETP